VRSAREVKRLSTLRPLSNLPLVGFRQPLQMSTIGDRKPAGRPLLPLTAMCMHAGQSMSCRDKSKTTGAERAPAGHETLRLR